MHLVAHFLPICSLFQPLDVSATKFINDFMKEAIPDEHDKHEYNLKNKPLMLDPFTKPRIKKRRRSVGLSAKDRKSLGLYKIPKEKQKLVS